MLHLMDTTSALDLVSNTRQRYDHIPMQINQLVIMLRNRARGQPVRQNALALSTPPEGQTPASEISIRTSTIIANVTHCFSPSMAPPSNESRTASSIPVADHKLRPGEGTASGSVPFCNLQAGLSPLGSVSDFPPLP